MYLRYKNLDPAKINLKNLHQQDPNTPHAKNNSQKFDVDGRVYPTGPQKAYPTIPRGCRRNGGEGRS